MSRIRLAVVLVAAAGLWSPWVAAQDAASTTDLDQAMAELRVREARAADDATIDAWIQARLTELAVAADNDALHNFVARFDVQIDDANATEDFRNRLAERAGAVFAAQFVQGDRIANVVARALARALQHINRVRGIEGLRAGLGSVYPDVRYICAKTFVSLQGSLAVDQIARQPAIELLRDAGVRETNGVVLARIYDALFFPNGQHLGETFGPLLEILDARLVARRQRNVVVDRGEVELFDQTIKRLAQNLSTNQQSELVRRVAVFLRLDVERYQASRLRPDQRLALDYRIHAEESLLAQIVGASNPGAGGRIRNAMRDGGEPLPQNMQQELAKWIGGPDADGALNGAPWNVPTGAP